MCHVRVHSVPSAAAPKSAAPQPAAAAAPAAPAASAAPSYSKPEKGFFSKIVDAIFGKQ